MVHAVIFCFCLLLFAQGDAVYKRWKLDTNFENPQNWNVKRAPCGNDVVIIPDDSPVVYMQLNTTVKELVLPKNGELILGTNTQLGFTASPADACEDAGGDVEFTAVHPGPWMDPQSWCTAAAERGACDNSSRLDVEKVPCSYDDVIFPRNHAYFVDLSNIVANTSLKSLKITGSSFTSASLATFLNSTDGKRMFQRDSTNTASLSITRKACDRRGGCSCGNDRPQIASKVCAHVDKNCDRPRCPKTILPGGMCCRMCGVYFNMTKGRGFDFDDFKSILKEEFLDKASGVSPIVSVMTGDWVQLLLSDRTGQKSDVLAKKIKADLDKDLANGGHKYALDKYEVYFSTKEPPSSVPQKDLDKSLSGGSIAGIIIAVIICILIIVLIVVVFAYRRTGRPLPTLASLPSLPRMPRLGGLNGRRVQSRGTTFPHTAPHVDPGFANPMYDSAPYDDDFVIKEMEMIGSIKEEQPTFEAGGAGFQNPLYGKSGASRFKDPVQVDTPGDEATTSGVAVTPSSGASPGPAAPTDISSGTTASAAAATGILLDFHTDSQTTDSTI